MIKAILVTILFWGTSVLAIDLEAYKKRGCEGVYVHLATQYLNNNSDFLRNHPEYSSIEYSEIYKENGKFSHFELNEKLSLCEVDTYNQGSWQLTREVTLCGNEDKKITFETFGNLWCSDERIISVKSVM